MARIVKQEEYTAKTNEILDTVQRLIFTLGYERMSIQDILNELQISKGAFYHYFASKPALLEAFIQRMLQVSEGVLRPIVQDPNLSALEKLQGFFAALDQLRLTHRADVIRLLRIWYTDENAIVRQKVEAAAIDSRAHLLREIVRQGIQEGVFTTAYPEQAGEVILSLLQGMGNTHARLMLALDQGDDEQRSIKAITAAYAAYMNAIERVLGAPSGSVYRAGDGTDALQAWLSALRKAR